MKSHARKSPRTVLWIAGIAVTVLGALMGCTPSENVAVPAPPPVVEAPAAKAPAGPTQAQIDSRARAQAQSAQAQAAQAQAAQAQAQAEAQARAQADAEARAQAEARARAEGRAQGRAQERAQDRKQDRAEDRARERARADNTPDRGRCRECGVIESVREIEKRAKSGRNYEITIRFYDGSRRVIHEASAPEWRIGDRVRVVNGVIRSNA